MGRFLTRDTWEGDFQNPMSYNLWGYVQSNPINYTDPTGMCWIALNGSVNAPLVWVSDNALPCRQQPGQLPGPALWLNEDQSQYIDHLRPDGSVQTYYNLCGHFSVEMVIEALTGKPYSIHTLINALDKYGCNNSCCGDTGTTAYDLAMLLTPIVGQQAVISTYMGLEYNIYELDNTGKARLFNRNKHILESYWYLDAKGNNIGLDVMEDLLRQKNYLIIGVVMDKNNGSIVDHIIEEVPSPRYIGHWVTVKSVIGNLVEVINPFRNRLETYHWDNVLKGSIEKAGWLVRIDPK
jgi:hypothetical protein